MEIRVTKLELLKEVDYNSSSDSLEINLDLDKDKKGFHVYFKYGKSTIKEYLYGPSVENSLNNQVFYLMKIAFNAGIQQGKIEQKEEIQKAIGANIILKKTKDD